MSKEKLVTITLRYSQLLPGWDPQSGVNNHCVSCTVKALKANKNPTTKKFVRFHKHSPVSTMERVTLFDYSICTWHKIKFNAIKLEVIFVNYITL